MIDIPCVIFAGGKSSRMGEDKALLPFGDFKTLTEYQLSRLQKIFKTVYISCKNKSKFNFDAKFIEDVKTDNVYAPTAGFVAIFNTLQAACPLGKESFFAISVDSPFINEDVISQIIKKDTLYPRGTLHVDATIAKTTSGIQPMCGIYHNSLASKFQKMLEEDNHKLGFLLKSSNTLHVEFEDGKSFLNLNNPDDYKEALLLL